LPAQSLSWCAPARLRRAALLAVGVVLGWTLLALLHTAAALADGPGNGTPWVVTVGDSYISGEAGRWAGNTNNSSSEIDALGPTAYDDNATDTAETIPGCHRSHSDEAYVGGGVNGEDLACSGAETSSYTDSSSGDFKPGLDFYNSGGNEGQALQLQQFAATHNVKLVLVTIGGNNYNFASIVQDCVEDFLISPSWWPDYCSTDSSVTKNFTSSNVNAVTAAIKGGLLNVNQAMVNAGYNASNWTMLVQDYPSPIPNGSGIRYSQSGYTRQSTGGCGFWNTDANWANSTALPTINDSLFNAANQTGLANLGELNISSAFNGHRLCETGVGLLEEEGLSSWTQSGAAQKSEWINQIRTVSTLGNSPYQLQEDFHPNYWGQLALRDCVRRAYDNGAPHGGTCTNTGGVDSLGEPNMSLH
jgi:hypothetical protein